MKKYILTALIYFISLQGWAQSAQMMESISNASQIRIRGQVEIQAANGGKQYSANRLARAENEKVMADVSGMGFNMMNDASIAQDGTIFALASRGQGSQTQLFLILFIGEKKVILPVTNVTATKIFFQGGTLEIKSGSK